MLYDNRMTILIPMAGKGQRFVDAGYTIPKPFIPIPPWNTPMIQSVIINLLDPTIDQKFVFVTKGLSEDQKKLLHKWTAGKPTFITEISTPQKGQTWSCLEAKKHIDNSSSLLIANSDQLIGQKKWQSQFYQYLQEWQPEGCLTVFPNNHPKWSYVKIDNGMVVQTAEKNPISEIATCGHYWFKHGSRFVELAENQIARQETVNGEYYVCPLYNQMIQSGEKVLPYFVNNFIGLGTPEDLNRYEAGHSRYNIF